MRQASRQVAAAVGSERREMESPQRFEAEAVRSGGPGSSHVEGSERHQSTGGPDPIQWTRELSRVSS